MLAQGVLGRGQHGLHLIDQRFGQPLGQRCSDLVGVIQLVGHPGDLGVFTPRHGDHALGKHAADGRGPHPLGHFFERGIEHALVMIAQGQNLHQLRSGRCGIPLLQLLAHEGLQFLFQFGVVKRRHAVGHPFLQLLRKPLQIVWHHQQLANFLCQVVGRHALQQHFLFKKLVAHELGQGIGQPLAVARNDGRVRNRQTQRVPEQGGNGKPVCQCAHGRGLGKGADPAPPATPPHDMARHQQGQRHQQGGQGHAFHASQGAGFFVCCSKHHETKTAKKCNYRPVRQACRNAAHCPGNQPQNATAGQATW